MLSMPQSKKKSSTTNPSFPGLIGSQTYTRTVHASSCGAFAADHLVRAFTGLRGHNHRRGIRPIAITS